jgi:hypothetical protein
MLDLLVSNSKSGGRLPKVDTNFENKEMSGLSINALEIGQPFGLVEIPFVFARRRCAVNLICPIPGLRSHRLDSIPCPLVGS